MAKRILRDLLVEKKRPLVMGILNVTPDSFSDGGKFISKENAMLQVEQMIADGVDILDIGGESTRPGAQAVSEQEEIDRVLPIIEMVSEFDVPISVDTSKALVMREAIASGAVMINDVRALQEEGALDAVAKSDAEVCLMHMQGQPRTMQQNPYYDDVIQDMFSFFEHTIRTCDQAGIERQRICIDPGFGFGKTLQNNCHLMQKLEHFSSLQVPLLIGVSRKTMLGQILDIEVLQRKNASVVSAMYSMTKGAKILRVHDVKETVEAVKIFQAFESK